MELHATLTFDELRPEDLQSFLDGIPDHAELSAVLVPVSDYLSSYTFESAELKATWGTTRVFQTASTDLEDITKEALQEFLETVESAGNEDNFFSELTVIDENLNRPVGLIVGSTEITAVWEG